MGGTKRECCFDTHQRGEGGRRRGHGVHDRVRDGRDAANENSLKVYPTISKSLDEGQTDTLQPSAYDNFKMPPAPWKWCHSESYQGNRWRVALTNELKRLVDVYKAAGKVSDFELFDLE